MLDIWTPIVNEKNLHENFRALTAQPHHAETLKTIQSWTEGFVDRDNKIIQEFQKTFNSSFWEFYLNAAFKELGFEIDFSHARPDFLLKKSDNCIIAEAAIANHPDGAQPEWIRDSRANITPEKIREIMHLATIRIANSIQKKHKKICDEYITLEHVKKKPFVLCIAPFEQPYFFLQSDIAIRRVLYKYDSPLYTKDIKSNTINIVGEKYVNNIEKDNGTEIELGFFTDNRMKEISAIIFSSTATATKAQSLKSDKYPNTLFLASRYNANEWDKSDFIAKFGGEYTETLLDGLHIFFNPFAEVQVDPEIFDNNDLTYHFYDTESSTSFVESKDGSLISHSCVSFTNGSPAKTNKHINKKSFVKKIPSWNEDTLYKIDATVMTGINNHIAHYKLWTIIVFQDKIDLDWGYIAKPIIVFDLQEFILYTENSIGLEDFYQTRDEAYQHAKDEINALLEICK